MYTLASCSIGGVVGWVAHIFNATGKRVYFSIMVIHVVDKWSSWLLSLSLRNDGCYSYRGSALVMLLFQVAVHSLLLNGCEVCQSCNTPIVA